MKHSIKPHFARAAGLALAVSLASTAAMAQAGAIAQTAQADAVGEVSLVLGKAWIIAADKSRQQIMPGTQVHASDGILTEANGHVHIRFVDQGLVSVRPDSRLEIVQYQYNPDQPEQSSIKLHLQEGVTRSISGRGASSARERFRLNTPIAAIGVRGTDFVVSASYNSVRALVNEGAIVLAPFSSDCTQDTFGPCATNSIELTDNTLQMIEMGGNNGAPRLMPASVERDPDMMRDEVNMVIASVQSEREESSASSGSANNVYLENVTSVRVKSEAASVAAPAEPDPVDPVTPPDPVDSGENEPEPPVVVTPPDTPEEPPEEPPVITPPVLVDVTPEIPVEAPVLARRNLVWGRWGAGQGEAERITLAYAEAVEGRDVTIGNADYILFRDGDGRTRVQSGLGPVSFSLTSAQAFYSSESGVVAMTVSDGALDIDFDTSRFSTQLDLSHDLTGSVIFAADGRLYDGGYFHTRSESERIAGAVSLDGAEAGYFFEKQLENGGIQGLTLWDRR